MYSDEMILESLEATITALDAMSTNLIEHCPPYVSSPYHMMDRNGAPALAPLVIARANAFAAYTALRIEQKTQARYDQQNAEAQKKADTYLNAMSQGVYNQPKI